MKSIVIAALVAASGIVESVREVQLAEGPAAGVFEHTYKPLTRDELRVRLDDGRAITVVPGGMQIFQPGQRVLVVPDRKGVRIEHLLFQP